MNTQEYLEYLDEDFTVVNKVFKANAIQGIFKKLKKSVKGKNINMAGVSTALKRIPVLTQDKIVIMQKLNVFY